MDEEETTQDKPEEPTEDTDERVQQKTTSALDRADEIVKRQKQENDRSIEILERKEAFEARKTVGGVTEAGQPAKKEEVTNKEYAEKALSGELNAKKE